MESRSQNGHLLLADISGYTSFMAGTELEHAHDIIGELLELIISKLTPAMSFSKLEGDAVFVYAPNDRFSRGESLLELIESTYVAFRDHVLNIKNRTTCECNACRAVPTLDLKFLVHSGLYMIQTIAGNTELAGSDVNLAHRLLKNHVTESTGWRGYALFTQASVEQLKLPADGMQNDDETYEHLGAVHTCSLDLHVCYDHFRQMRHIVVTPEEADTVFECECVAPPAVVWEYLNDPDKRSLWMEGRHFTSISRPGGRTTVGARNHCAHGKDVAHEIIIDWHPFEYFTFISGINSDKEVIRQTNTLEPLNNGACTRVRVYFKMAAPLPGFLRRPLCNYMMRNLYKVDRCMELLSQVTAPSTPLEGVVDRALPIPKA